MKEMMMMMMIIIIIIPEEVKSNYTIERILY